MSAFLSCSGFETEILKTPFIFVAHQIRYMIRLSLLLSFFILFTDLADSQQIIDLDLLENMSMRSIGPATMSGRVTSIDVVREEPSIIYIGTASGGLWKSESMGIDWEPIFDDQPLQSIGAVAISPSNSSIIWAGTGEGNPRNSHASGAGIYKSLDAGRTWELMGLEETKTIHRIIVDPKDPDIVYVGAMGSPWGENEERGVYRSVDGGKTWEKVLYLNDKVGCADLVMDPTNPRKLIAAMWEYGRKPWTFNSGGEGSGIHISHDGGENWTERTKVNGLPEKPIGRTGLAISASNPKVIYALVESKKTGLYKSEDGGFNWNLVSTENIGNRPFYYADIFVDPSNENRLFNLYSMVSMSEDGGKTFETILPYSGVHPDHHAFYIHPDNPDFMIDGNDGGLNISHDGGENWQYMNNIPVGQFYHINHDMDVPYHIYGGMQDNGSWQGPGYVWHSDGIRNEDWKEILFGDGFDVVPHPDDSRYAYAMYQGGNVYEVDIQTGASRYIKPVHPEGEPLRYNWNGAIAQDPFNNDGLYFGSQHVHHSLDRGASWDLISPDLTTNDTTKQKQAESGGLTIDATQAENFTTILCIAPSPLNKEVIWAGTDDGNIQLTRDGGKNWKLINPKSKDFPKGAWIPQIEVNRFNEAEAFVVINDYRRNNWEPYLYHTVDFGKSWNRLVETEDVSGHCHAIVQDAVEENLLFLGTENGLYFSLNKGGDWQKWDNDYPSVSTIDLKIHPRENDLIIGTFGRAAFILDDISPLRELSRNTAAMDSSFAAWGKSKAYLSFYRRPAGERFSADHYFVGENKPSGAMMNLWVHPKLMEKKENTEEKEEKEEKEDDGKIHMSVLAENGDTIRNLHFEPDTGLMRVRWGLERNGIHWPSRSERKEEDNIPGGSRVGPGEYELHFHFKDHHASTTLEVLPDPRVKFDRDRWTEKEEIREKVEEMISDADSAFERMKSAKKTLALLENNLSVLEEAERDSLSSSIGEMKKALAELEKLYMTPEGFEGYDHVTIRLNNYLSMASGYLGQYQDSTGGNFEAAYQLARNKTDEALVEINTFFVEKWKPFKKETESLQFDLFHFMNND